MAFMQVVYILKTGFNLNRKKIETDTFGKCYGSFNTLLIFFSIGWFIVGKFFAV